MTIMKELVKKIMETELVLNKNMEDNLNGNKAAGVRARKNTLELEKMFKQYRKLSVEAAKSTTRS